MTAVAVLVDDVVVEQREVVDQLDGHGSGDARLLGAAGGRRRNQHQCGPDPLAPAGQVMAHWLGQLGAETVDSRIESRSDEGGGAPQGLGEEGGHSRCR